MAKKKDKTEHALIGEFPAIRMKAPKHATSVSFEGEEYLVEDGHVIVPAHAESDLKDAGYTDEDEDEAVA